jgi:hypothetical protein
VFPAGFICSIQIRKTKNNKDLLSVQRRKRTEDF